VPRNSAEHYGQALQRTFGEPMGLPAEVPVAPIVPEIVECVECSDEFPRDSITNSAGGEPHCRDCYSAAFQACISCSDELCLANNEDQYGSNGNDGPYCQECYDSAFTRCYACSTPTANDDIRSADNGRDYCESCYNERFTCCAGCANELHFDSVAYCDEYDGESYCSNCAPSDEYDDDSEEWNGGREVVATRFERMRSRRRFGIELEISECPNYATLRGNTPFGAKYDGSLSAGKEFVSPILAGDEGIEAVDNLCNFGREHKWDVDNSCGYHVHLDCGDLNEHELKAVAIAYAGTADLWGKFVAPKRRNNTYCGKLDRTATEMLGMTFRQILSSTGGRYKWCNWDAYNEHQTCEIRLHSGTVNRDKIINWAKVHAYFIDGIVKLQRAGKTDREIHDMFVGKSIQEVWSAVAGLIDDAELCRFYEKRAMKWKCNLKQVASAVPVAVVMSIA
jgi:hypothetical protein